MNYIAPESLTVGDVVYLCAPSKAIEEQYVIAAENWLSSNGLVPIRGKHLIGRHHYFSGTINERLLDLQEGIDLPEARAIWCVRGGYGSIQILDGVQWAAFLQRPKWMVGISDICVLHHKIQALGYQSIHATMALNIEKNTTQAKTRLLELLLGEKRSFKLNSHADNKTGVAEGVLLGGNLSIIYSLLASPECYRFSDSILFIEDLAEHIYHIDRMMFALSKAGALDSIKGLIIGSMTDLEDTDVPFGKSINEVILSHFTYRNIPICFDFPVGHIDDNQALLLGAKVCLEVNENQSVLNYQ